MKNQALIAYNAFMLPKMDAINRRDFLKLAGAAVGGLVLSACGLNRNQATATRMPTPTPTFIPTETPTITLTETPTVAKTATATATIAATATEKPKWVLPLTKDTEGNQVFDFTKVSEYPALPDLTPATVRSFLDYLEQPSTGLVRPFPDDAPDAVWTHKVGSDYEELSLPSQRIFPGGKQPVRNIAVANFPHLLIPDGKGSFVDASDTVKLVVEQFRTRESPSGYVLVATIHYGLSPPNQKNYFESFSSTGEYADIYINSTNFYVEDMLKALQIYDYNALEAIAKHVDEKHTLPVDINHMIVPSERASITVA